MNKYLLLKRFAAPLGIYNLSRFLTQSSPRILMYHRFSSVAKPGYVSAETFASQIAYLKTHYHLVGMTDLVRGLRGETKLRRNTIALTVDDGYADFYDIAYPILKSHGATATVFVTTRFADGNLWLWPDRVSFILSRIEHLSSSLDAGVFTIGPGHLSSEQRKAAWGPIVSFLLTLEDEEKHKWLDKFSQLSGVPVPTRPTKEYAASPWIQLKEMQDNGIEIGGHTATHPSLGRVTLQQLKLEIEECKAALDKNLGLRERQFCYPNGQPQDLNSDVKEAVRTGGFSSAVVAFYDKQALSDPFELRRYSSADDHFQFLKAANGIELLASKLTDSHNRQAWQF